MLVDAQERMKKVQSAKGWMMTVVIPVRMLRPEVQSIDTMALEAAAQSPNA
jgi:hypothetical protein